MKKRHGLLVCILLLSLLASGLAAAQETAETPETDYEIVRTLSYGLGVFEPDLWRMAGAEETLTDTHVLWRYRSQEDMLFFFVRYLFSEPLTAERIADFFDDAYFEETLANYQPYEATATCQHDDLTLYEFRSKQAGVTRILRYWVRQVDDQVMLSVNGIAPENALATLDDYAARLFPALPACDAA